MEHGSAARHIPGPEHPHLQVVKNLPEEEGPKSVEAVRAELEAIDTQIAVLTTKRQELVTNGGFTKEEEEWLNEGGDSKIMAERLGEQKSNDTFAS